MSPKSSCFLLGYNLYQEEAGVLYFFTPQGSVVLYDAYLMRRPYARLRHQPEHLFEITYAPSALNPQSLFLKSWDVKQPVMLSPERLCLWQGLIAFARLIEEQEALPNFFKLYVKTFELLSQEETPMEKIYFMLGYILLEAITMMGIGDVSYHYEKIWKRLQLSESFHQDFLHHGLISQEHFGVVLSYIFEVSSQISYRPEVILYLRLCLQYPPK